MEGKDKELWDQLLSALLAEKELLAPEDLEHAERLGASRGESLRTTVLKEGLLEEEALERLYESAHEDEPLLPVPPSQRMPAAFDLDSWPDDLARPLGGAPTVTSVDTISLGEDTAHASPAPPGRRLGPYVILEELGRGGCGVVHRAYDLRHEREVALKQLLKSTETSQRRFAREREAAARLRHPHVVAVLDEGEAGGLPYLVMELIEGPSLAVLARDEGGRPAPPPVETAARLLREAALGVQAAHDVGVLHRDLKPHNVLVDRAQERALVADFGLAQMLDRGATFTREGATVGTLAFMAPEQIGSGGQALDARCDVYALGATLYFTLTGTAPFVSTSYGELLEQVRTQPAPAPSATNPAVPPALDAIVARCMQKHAEGRYQRARDLAQALERFLSGEPEPPPARAGSASLALPSAVALGLGLLLAGALLVYGLGEGPKASPSPSPSPSGSPQGTASPLPASWTLEALARASEDPRAPAALQAEVEALGARWKERWATGFLNVAVREAFLRASAGEPTALDQATIATLGSASDFGGGLGDWSPVPEATDAELRDGQLLASHLLRDAGLAPSLAARAALGAPLREPLAPPKTTPAWEAGLRELLPRITDLRLAIPLARALARVPTPGARRTLLALREARDPVFARELRPFVSAAPAEDARWLSWGGHHERALVAGSRPALQGQLLWAAGNTREASALLAGAVRPGETDTRAWSARARARREAGQLRGARADLLQARALAPASAAVAREQAELSLAARRSPRLWTALRRALWLDPSSPTGWRLAARALQAQGRPAERLRALDRALRLDPADTDALYLRGRLRLSLGRAHEALADATQALERDRPTRRLLLLRGTAYEALDRLEEALAEFEQALILEPTHALTWANRAHVRTRSGDPAGALDDCAEALRTAPRLAIAWLNRGEALRRLERLDEAWSAFLRAGELGSSAAAFGLSRVARARADHDSEELLLDRVVRREPWRRAAWDRRAELRARRGDLGGAYTDLEHALAGQPTAERLRKRAAWAEAAGRADLAAQERWAAERLER